MIIIDTPEYFHTRSESWWDKDGELVLGHYVITRENKVHNYIQVEVHDYCPYRTKGGKIEHSTFTSKWFDNRGNMEEFVWNVEENCVDTYNSYTSFYLDGVRYYSKKSYDEAVNEKRS